MMVVVVVIVKYCLDQVDRFPDYQDCVKTVMTATDADVMIVADLTIVADLITATKRNGNMEKFYNQQIHERTCGRMSLELR